VLVPQYSYTNLSSAAGHGLIGFSENDIAIDYVCILIPLFIHPGYAKKLRINIG